MRELDDLIPFVRGIVAEYGSGFNMVEVEYEQPKRRAGKTHNNFLTLYDAAMLSITSYIKMGLRIATLIGFLSSAISLVVALIYLILKLIHWEEFQAGYTPMILGIFMLALYNYFLLDYWVNIY